MSPISTFSVAVEIRPGRIPVRWTVRDHHIDEVRNVDGRVIEKGRNERVFWPQVEATKRGDVKTHEIEDPTDLRAVLFKAFRTNWEEKSILAFLDRIGAWQVVTDDRRETWAKGRYANVAYRHRLLLNARVLPVTLHEVQRETDYWYQILGLLGNHAKLKEKVKSPPSDDARPCEHFAFAAEAQFSNTLPVSLEWYGREPRAVIAPITASELLAAAAWADIVGDTAAYVCAHCHTRFASPRKKKYCLGECGHNVAVRNYKRKCALEKAARIAEIEA
jgi:hypothetical protein